MEEKDSKYYKKLLKKITPMEHPQLFEVISKMVTEADNMGLTRSSDEVEIFDTKGNS